MYEYSIDDIMDMLSWKKSEKVQQKGIELSKGIKSINVFIKPLNPENGWDAWDNCAKVLASKSDDLLNPYIFQLLEWLADIMKPGALIIYKRLRSFSKTDGLFSSAFELCAKEAIADKDVLWLGALAGLLNGNETMKPILNTKLSEVIVSTLQDHYENFEWLNEE